MMMRRVFYRCVATTVTVMFLGVTLVSFMMLKCRSVVIIFVIIEAAIWIHDDAGGFV